MRARMISSLAGPEGVCDAGKVVEGPDARIQELIDGGYAEPYVHKKDVEEAVSCRLREVATSPHAKRKGPAAHTS